MWADHTRERVNVFCVFQGAENCLEGCVFVLTGVLESMERDDAKTLIERYGGKVTGNISKKTSYLVQGRDSGVSKLEKVTNKPNKNPDSVRPESGFHFSWSSEHKMFWNRFIFFSFSAQAESLGTKIIDEDGLLDLIRTKPGKKSKYEIAAEAEVSCQIKLK